MALNPSQKVVSGARSIVMINGTSPIGIFTSFNYGLSYGLEPVFLLGRFSAAETVYTSQEVVTATGSGFRVINNGPHSNFVKMPKLQDLLDAQYTTLSVFDRQTGENMAVIRDAKIQSYAIDNPAKGLSGITFTYMALRVEDEAGSHNEAGVYADLP